MGGKAAGNDSAGKDSRGGKENSEGVMKVKAKEIRVNDKLVVPWDEPPKEIIRIIVGRPGRGIKGRGIHVFYNDETGSFYRENEIVEVIRVA